MATGMQQRMIQLTDDIVNLSYEDNGQSLVTECGRLRITSNETDGSTQQFQTKGDIFLDGNFVVHNEVKLLRIPAVFAPYNSIWENGSLALVHRHGWFVLPRSRFPGSNG